MIFLESIANTLGTFPDATGKNASGGAATDGTPWIRSFIDNYFGLSQALLDAAGMTPDAATDVHDACQQLDALRFVSGPIGSGADWYGIDTDPSSLGIRLLPLTGQGVLIANYVDLDAACYVGNTLNPTAEAFYRATDAAGTARSPSGTYLILPDARGQVLRGLDLTGTIDPDGASRAVGDIQVDSIEDHEHDVRGATSDDYAPKQTNFFGTGTVDGFWPTASRVGDFLQAKDIATGSHNADETRMTNLAVRHCIWY